MNSKIMKARRTKKLIVVMVDDHDQTWIATATARGLRNWDQCKGSLKAPKAFWRKWQKLSDGAQIKLS